MCTVMLFPFNARHSAPVLSLTSHCILHPHNLPHGHSSQRQSDPHSGPKSVVVMFFLCICVLSCMQSPLPPILRETFSQRRSRSSEGVSPRWWSAVSERSGVGRSSSAATGRGQRGWRCLPVAPVILFEPGLRSKACRSVQRGYSDKGCMREAEAVLQMTRLVERGDYVTVLMSCRSLFLLGFNLVHEVEHFLNLLDLLCARP